MKRNEHLFQFSGKAISEAAKMEADYHTERIVFWKQEYDTAVAKAKEEGLQVTEYLITGGKRAQMVINPTLQERINECSNKIYSHGKIADALQIEAACYGTQSERVYELHPDDVIYFRLAGGPRDD